MATLDDRIVNLKNEFCAFMGARKPLPDQQSYMVVDTQAMFQDWIFKKLAEIESVFAVMGELHDRVQELKRESNILFDT